LLGSGFNPFLLFFWVDILCLCVGCRFFLLHEVEVEASFYNNFNEEVFPVFKQSCELLFEILGAIFALLFFCWGEGNQH
jgi:hypothetical protein